MATRQTTFCDTIASFSSPSPPPLLCCSAFPSKFERISLPKCKSEKSREGAFYLLNELALGCTSNLNLVRRRSGSVGNHERLEFGVVQLFSATHESHPVVKNERKHGFGAGAFSWPCVAACSSTCFDVCGQLNTLHFSLAGILVGTV